MTPPRVVLTAKEAAEFLQIDVDSLYFYVFDITQPHLRKAHQRIPGFRVTRKAWRFHLDTLNAIVKGEFALPSPVVPFKARRSA